MIFEHNTLIPYKNASGGGSNIQTFGKRQQMRRLWYTNNTQLLCPTSGAFCPPSHLETVTLDAGAGYFEGQAAVSADGLALTTAGTAAGGTYQTTVHRADWRFAAVLLLTGTGAGQWRRGTLGTGTNDTWQLDTPFVTGTPAEDTFVVVTKDISEILFVGNTWSHSHFQLYAECLDCVVAVGLSLSLSLPLITALVAQHSTRPGRPFGVYRDGVTALTMVCADRKTSSLIPSPLRGEEILICSSEAGSSTFRWSG
jgi:hypothetical protein